MNIPDNCEVHSKHEVPTIPPGYSLNTHCRYATVSSIIEKVKHFGALDRFLESPFGFLQHLPREKFSFQARVSLHILQREVKINRQRPDEMWFKIGGRLHRFSAQEFCLLTGLKFGSIRSNSIPRGQLPETSVLHRLFPKYFNVRLKQVMDLMSREGVQLAIDDVLTMAFAALVSGWLLGRDDKAIIPNWIWSLVEDRVAFHEFPWGP